MQEFNVVPTAVPKAMALEPITTDTTDIPETSEGSPPKDEPPLRPHAEVMELFKHFMSISLDTAVHKMYLIAQNDIMGRLVHKHVLLSEYTAPVDPAKEP